MSSTPLQAGEPLGFQPTDSLLTIQGFPPAASAALSNRTAGAVVHFSDLIAKPASDQAQYFLNVYFDNISGADKKRIFDEWELFKVIQKENGLGEDSSSIPQTLATLFFQRLGRTMTPQEFKDQFKNVDTNFDGKMAFLEYLVWDLKLGSPAQAIYRPIVQDQALFNAINKALDAERAVLGYENDLKAKEEAAASLTGVKGVRAQQELNTFKENTDLARINASLASAYESLGKKRVGTVERGTQYWADTLQAQADSRKPQKAQK